MIRSAITLLFADTILRDIRSNGPPERPHRSRQRFPAFLGTMCHILLELKPTVHVQQQTPGFLHDDRSGRDVPAVDADLEEGLDGACGHQAHVGGGRPRAAQPGGTKRGRQTSV